MENVPITFEFRGKKYTGHFGRVAGAGSSSHFHLTVGGYHYGQLWFSDRGVWRFESNAFPEMSELAEEFGAVVTGWYG